MMHSESGRANPIPSAPEILDRGRETVRLMEEEIRKIIFGEEVRDLINFLIMALYVDEHVLVNSHIGLGKSTICEALAKTIGGNFNKQFFTPDTKPSDLTGYEFFNEKTREFDIHHGPLHDTHIFLADEINRTLPQTQSALLGPMESRQVIIGTRVFPLSDPFLVLATENPIEHEGTYDLPEAQLDRFLGQSEIPHFSVETLVKILSDKDYWLRAQKRLGHVQAVTDPKEILMVRRALFEGGVDVGPRIDRYIARIINAIQKEKLVESVAETRSVKNLKKAAAFSAFKDGKAYAEPEHVVRHAIPILKPRIFMTFEARSSLDRRTTREDLISKALEDVHYE